MYKRQRDDKAGNFRILVVEDNPDLRHFLYVVLIDDYNVALAANGAVALALALEDPPDLVITDLMMPLFDGEQFVRELRASGRFPNVPVLVLSARADDALRETLLEELVQDYPVSYTHLDVYKRQGWNDTWGQCWDVIIDNVVDGNMAMTYPETLPYVCNMCQLPILGTPGKGWNVKDYPLEYLSLIHI